MNKKLEFNFLFIRELSVINQGNKHGEMPIYFATRKMVDDVYSNKYSKWFTLSINIKMFFSMDMEGYQ